MNQQPTPMGFVWNAEAAELAKTAGTAGGITETGAYEGVITSAVYHFGKDGSQSQALEISLDCNGAKANYLRINYCGKDGTPTFGLGLINSLLWACQVKEAQPVQQQTAEGIVWTNPALMGKKAGLMLQKVLYTKNDGGEGYKFEVRHVFQPGTRRTYSEFAASEPAKVIDHLCETMKDKDDRQQSTGTTMNRGWGQPQQPAPTGNVSRLAQNAGGRGAEQQHDQQWDDDIPF